MARVSIEDCQKVMPNRFALVTVAANRTRQLMSNSVPLVRTKNKQAVTALREIAERKVLMKGEIGAPFREDIDLMSPIALDAAHPASTGSLEK
jgi:DNA-directed RNA polymerase subunit omega